MAAFAIVSKKNTEGAATADFNTGKAAVGIGPFKFGEWVKGDRLVLEANPDYWGEKFGWDRLIWKPISSEGSRVAALLSGDVDFIDRVPVVDIPKLKQNPKLTVTQTPSCRTMFLHPDQGRDISPYLMTNDGKPMFPNPMRDQRVRKAMSKAIDRQAIVERVLAGHGVVASQHPPSTLFGHDPNIMVEAYDPQGAKALLKQAGYGDGFQLTIHGTNNRYDNDGPILEAIAQMLTQVGITTKVESMPASVFFKKLFQLEFSLAMAGNCPGMADAGSVLKEFIISPRTRKGLRGLQRPALLELPHRRNHQGSAGHHRQHQARAAVPRGTGDRVQGCRDHPAAPPGQHLGVAQGGHVRSAHGRDDPSLLRQEGLTALQRPASGGRPLGKRPPFTFRSGARKYAPPWSAIRIVGDIGTGRCRSCFPTSEDVGSTRRATDRPPG